MSLDTTAKTYSFSGSTSGTPNDGGGFGEIFYSFAGTGSPTLNGSVNDSSVFNIDTGGFIGAVLFVQDDGSVDFNINTTATTAVTLTGNGNTLSYSGFTPTVQSAFEGVIGSSLTLNTGSGFEAISVQAAVPEPKAFALYSALLAFVWVGFRRKVAKR